MSDYVYKRDGNLMVEIRKLVLLLIVINVILFFASAKILIFIVINIVFILYNLLSHRVYSIVIGNQTICIYYKNLINIKTKTTYELANISYRIKNEGISKNSIRQVLRIYIKDNKKKSIKIVSNYDGWTDEAMCDLLEMFKQLGVLKI